MARPQGRGPCCWLPPGSCWKGCTGGLQVGSRGSVRGNERVCSKVRSQRLLKERSYEHQWGWHKLAWLRKPLRCRAEGPIPSCKETKELCFKAFYLIILIQTFRVFSYLLNLILGSLFCSAIKKCFRDWRSSGMLASQKVWSSFTSNLLPVQVPSQHSAENWRAGYVSPVSRLNSLSRFMSAQKSWDNLKSWKIMSAVLKEPNGPGDWYMWGLWSGRGLYLLSLMSFSWLLG